MHVRGVEKDKEHLENSKNMLSGCAVAICFLQTYTYVCVCVCSKHLSLRLRGKSGQHCLSVCVVCRISSEDIARVVANERTNTRNGIDVNYQRA